jgi:hypothetical protein
MSIYTTINAVRMNREHTFKGQKIEQVGQTSREMGAHAVYVMVF